MTGWFPSFRGALHAEDVQAEATAAIDPSPLIGDAVDGERPPDEGRGEGAGGGRQDAGDALDEQEQGGNILPTTPTWRHPYAATKSFFSELTGYFGWQFLSWLAIDQCLISGGVFALVTALSLPLFKELGIGAARQQLYGALIYSPWAMKPFIGVASDLFPIGGYNKRYLAVFSILVGFVGCAVLLGVYQAGAAEAAEEAGGPAAQRLADVAVLCFALVSFEASTLDILGEGKYSELMRAHPAAGSNVISFKFGWALLGAIATTACVGPLSDGGHFRALFWASLVLAASPLCPTLAGWIPERRRAARERGLEPALCRGCVLFDRGSFREKKAMFVVIALCGLCAPITSAVTTYADLALGLACAGMMVVIFTVATYYIFPRSFFWAFLAIVLYSLSWISMRSPVGYYYTASEECVPGGPNFDYTYYVSVTGVVGSIVNFMGVILYQNTLSKWRFRTVLIVSGVLGSCASLVDVIIIMRWNLAIGIPDKVFFLLGNAVLENLISIMWGVATSALCAKLAPPGLEAAVFAYVVGIYNFCLMVSALLGSGVIEWSGMKTIGDDCNFAPLPYLLVACQVLVPITVGVPAAFLIPNKLQTEHLVDWEREGWGEERPTAGIERSEPSVISSDHQDEEAEDPRLEAHHVT